MNATKAVDVILSWQHDNSDILSDMKLQTLLQLLWTIASNTFSVYILQINIRKIRYTLHLVPVTKKHQHVSESRITCSGTEKQNTLEHKARATLQ